MVAHHRACRIPNRIDGRLASSPSDGAARAVPVDPRASCARRGTGVLRFLRINCCEHHQTFSRLIADGKMKRIRVQYADGDEEEWPIDERCPQRRRAARPKMQTSSYAFQHLRARPFWPAEMAGDDIHGLCAKLERCFTAIAKEAKSLLKPLLGSDEEDSASDSAQWESQGEGLHTGVWLRCMLWSRGNRRAPNLAALPTLATILDAAPAVMRDPPGCCYLSLMLAKCVPGKSGGSGGGGSAEGTRVAPHAGPSNHRLRIHLPILLPRVSAGQGASTASTAVPCFFPGIVVGGERRRWELGRCLVFDDSFEHSVDLSGFGEVRHSSERRSPRRARSSNDHSGNGTRLGEVNVHDVDEDEEDDDTLRAARLVLVLDVWHPDAAWLCPPERRA